MEIQTTIGKIIRSGPTLPSLMMHVVVFISFYVGDVASRVRENMTYPSPKQVVLKNEPFGSFVFFMIVTFCKNSYEVDIDLSLIEIIQSYRVIQFYCISSKYVYRISATD